MSPVPSTRPRRPSALAANTTAPTEKAAINQPKDAAVMAVRQLGSAGEAKFGGASCATELMQRQH